VSPETLAAWVLASCAAQGLQVKVTDPSTIRRVGTLMGVGVSARGKPSGRSRAEPRPTTATPESPGPD